VILCETSTKGAPVAAINVFTAPNPGRIDVAEALGSAEMAMYVYDVDSGEGSSPYHYEYVEEWLLVVDGSVVVRTPEGEITLERGDLFCFPGRAGRCTQGHEPERLAGENAVVLARGSPLSPSTQTATRSRFGPRTDPTT
jgi:uncharacterized cupin superfamily protein